MLTKEEIKPMLGIQDDSKDLYINAMLPVVYEFLEGYAGWTDITVVKLIDYHMPKITGMSTTGVQSYSLSRLSISLETDIPKSVMKGVIKKGRFV